MQIVPTLLFARDVAYGPPFVRAAAPPSQPACSRYRTIQLYPEDLRALPEQPESEVRWHSGFPEGGAHARLKTTAIDHDAERRRRHIALAARARRIGMLMGAPAADMEGQACIAAFRRAGSDSIF